MEVNGRQPFFKGPRVTEKVRRRRKREARDQRERDTKALVRVREKKITRRGCRFPLCGCHRIFFAIEVSHLTHKAMGGNPKEDRSTVDKMIGLCGARHRVNRFSIDQGTLQCRPLTDAGTNGPVAWLVSVADLRRERVIDFDHRLDWLELARESAPGVLEPLTPGQQTILEFLARMEV